MTLTPDSLRAVFPEEGLFADKDWLLSPEPFKLSPKLAEQITKLGHRLRVFLHAANALYFRSLKGKIPPWTAERCDAGKPADLLDIARAKPWKQDIPRVIRPDLLLTEEGVVLSEIDSVPGGIGLTAWLNRVYSTAFDVIGGPKGMLDGFASIFPAHASGVDIVVSQEAGDYRPEMCWLARQLNEQAATAPAPTFTVAEAESYTAAGRAVYRFFELFDLPNLPAAQTLLQQASADGIPLTPPPKPWLEEKLWLALFWLRPLHELWRRELSENQQRRLEKVIPYSWLIDPTPLPPHAVLPRLNINAWEEAAAFSQKQRALVLKRSGFHEEAWGARSVVIGHDVSQADWAAALQQAQADFPTHPWVMQEFHRARVVEHPYFDPATGEVRTMRGRARLCPYYFISAADNSITLGGILATIVPEDKKIIHGMKDAILVPCCVDTENES